MCFLICMAGVLSRQVAARAQMPYVGAPCEGAGEHEATAAQVASFKRFDGQLRAALKQNNVAAVAFLVKFPLRVNTERGTLLIPDASSLEGHFAEIFAAGVRERVLTTVAGDYICRYDEGLGYKEGVIWVSTDGKRFALDVVNAGGFSAGQTPKVQYTCETRTHRISISLLKGDAYRYQSWNASKPVTGPPDVDLSNGTLQFDGTGVCATSVYFFTKGDVRYEVRDGMGCTDGSEPAKATGHLSVFIADKQVTDAWCY